MFNLTEIIKICHILNSFSCIHLQVCRHWLVLSLNTQTDVVVGLTFVEMKDDMKKAYSLYCCNHEEALSLLDKVTQLSFKSNPIFPHFLL